ncbi:hypothetical protein PV328_000368 [Microctonus aethiopoides]|uniref:Major facilitator superfamily associated domain-containing protein n=1 Tax=Microctonus aethiopoides TaxID=144406 RepID=A0AA39FVF8_9HYME|nr:hypothetical protein PV328_000368 [Microctonus aethiopoides]
MSMASIETMGTATKDENDIKRKFVNTNLISLKCLLFIFFGGMGCLFPFLSLHMLALGLTIDEIRVVSMISPLVAIIGPLIAGPLADKLATRQGSKLSNGRYLRVMIALACFLSAVFYSLLLLVPVVERIELPREHRPTLKFSCNREGATVLQERNNEFSTCYNWTSESRVCAILLRNCDYACHPIVPQLHYQLPLDNSESKPPRNFPPTDTNIHHTVYEGSGDDMRVSPLDTELKQDEIEWRTKDLQKVKQKRYVIAESEPPHLCFHDGINYACHVYTNNTGSLPVNASFREASNARQKQEWCAYPIAEDFTCRIPFEMESKMAEFNQSCSIECEILDPFMLPGSVHTKNQCSQVAGDPGMTFWIYIVIRSIADIFPTAAVTLLNAAIVIATRETSCGRGDVGRQLAFGSLGFAIFGPLAGLLNIVSPISPRPPFLLPIVLHVVLMIIASIVVLSAKRMPLTPPEWWWHTRSGMLALPLSSIRRYEYETAALFLVLTIIGTFWSVMNNYLPIHLFNLEGNTLTIGVITTIGALPAVFLLWKSENVVDYCGHSNLLIVALTMYIVRYIGLILMSNPWWALFSQLLEIFTLGIMWVTVILYLRHLMPRHSTVTAQALPVIAHFCIGRCLGALIDLYFHGDDNDVNSVKFVYRYMSIAAAIVATVYFILYHGILKPRCHAQTKQNSKGGAPSIVQGMNGNGNYAPLRVYHNGMGKKGQFRY